MTRLFNEPAAFVADMVDGFSRAHARWVRAVPGGVVSTSLPQGSVAVVIGGGSGHYPAFGGLVGPGLASGAAMGNVFASPSARQVESVARAAERGAGVLLSYGNYAGDVLHFDMAQEKLRESGIPCETVVVTDDVASAPAGASELRRGIAGDLVVFKIAGAAATAGLPLPEVTALARRANDSTRSLGVAFSGCTLPGADKPLFEVPPGRMAVGLGIHGEPGLSETTMPTAAELAELLVSGLAPELEIAPGKRVAVILNGLGSVKYEELFVLYREIDLLVRDLGLVPVDPDVGEFCTSFDMAGLSLTLTVLDDELERWWSAPCESPAYRKGRLGWEPEAVADPAAAAPAGAGDEPPQPAGGSAESHRAAAAIAGGLDRGRDRIDAAAGELGRIDAVAGDGDHGIGMQRGITAAADAARRAVAAGAGAGSALAAAADAWADQGGGTSGALWGVALRAAAAHLGDQDPPTDETVSAAVAAAVRALTAFGKAAVGDKTMVDAAEPFAAALARSVSAGAPLGSAWREAAAESTRAAEATASIAALRGRARAHGDAGLGTPDPGAVSFALLMTAVGDLFAASERTHP